MATWLTAAHIAQALTVLALMASEIMPFLPTKANGVVQALISIVRAVVTALAPKDGAK